MFLSASSYVNVTLDVKHSQHPKCIQSCSRPPPPPWPPVPAELLIIRVRVCVSEVHNNLRQEHRQTQQDPTSNIFHFI